MSFEENSHCTFEERVELVAIEIKNAYPNISLADDVEIATLDEPIYRKADNDIKFMRYYYMMLILHNDSNMKIELYNELIKLVEDGINDNKLTEIMDEINKFMLNERDDFPIISEVYGY